VAEGGKHSRALSRRKLLERLGLGAAAFSAGACTPPPTASLPDRTPLPSSDWAGSAMANHDLFPMHVQSGAPRTDGLLFWTRYMGEAELELLLMVYEEEEWREHSRETVLPDANGYVHHLRDDLSPDTSVAYQFVDGDGLGSTVGHSRTALPEGSQAVLRFGATSCTSKNHIDFPSLNNLSRRYDLDFFCWLGDTVYADDAETPEEYRSFYEYNIKTDGFQSILSRTPGLFSWDDHEVANNWDIESIDPARLEKATAAYFQNLALEALPEHPTRIWRSFRFGDTAEVFVLDCRGERQPSKELYISREQMDWLKEGLSASKAAWKLILNAVPITQMPAVYQFPEMVKDRWEGFPAQREELLDHITGNQLSGVLFLSGDLHQCSLSRVEPSGPRASILEVCAGPSGPNFLGTPARFFEDGDQWLWADAEFCATYFACHGSGLCQIVAVDEQDNTLFEGIIDVHGKLLSATIFHPWEHLDD
jgi:alkaline phosphatase D